MASLGNHAYINMLVFITSLISNKDGPVQVVEYLHMCPRGPWFQNQLPCKINVRLPRNSLFCNLHCLLGETYNNNIAEVSLKQITQFSVLVKYQSKLPIALALVVLVLLPVRHLISRASW